MKFAIGLLLILGSTGWAQSKPGSQTFTGYLIDVACARERKDKEADLGEKHTRKCMEMPICNRSGFGLLTDGNELLPFDDGGNAKVQKLIARTNRKDGLRAVVFGTKSDDVLHVNKIELKTSTLHRSTAAKDQSTSGDAGRD